MNQHHILRAVSLGAALALSGATSHAQPAKGETPTTNPAPALENATIKVKYMPSNIMAYWLDPMHQPQPNQLRSSARNAGTWADLSQQMTRQPGNGNGPRDLKLPPEVEIVASVDPQNALLVKGTQAGLEALRKLVQEIDVPLKQVEVEAQIWEIAPAKLKSLSLVFRDTANDEEKTSQQGADKTADPLNNIGAGDYFARTAFAAPTSNIAPILQELTAGLADGSARVITAPSVIAIDGLVASLTSVEARALALDETPQSEVETTNGKEKKRLDSSNRADNNWNMGLTFLQSQTGFTAAPVLHGDRINLSFQLILNNNVTSASTIMRDGQTLAIRLPNANPTTGWTRVALITPRIIRHVGDTQ